MNRNARSALTRPRNSALLTRITNGLSLVGCFVGSHHETTTARGHFLSQQGLVRAFFRQLFRVYCSVEELMHQGPNPIHFLFQREMARVEKMELCTGNISFEDFSTL